MSAYVEWLRSRNWIDKGDCVYIVSDILDLAKVSREMGEKLLLNDIVEGLQDMVGEEGTLLFPTFNWDFCKGIGYDRKTTPVKTGALAKAAWMNPNFRRTAHPIYSFAVWGKGSDELLANCSVNSFGPGTIFEKLYEWNAKVLVIGLAPLKGTTYLHHVEQMVGVPYRYNKEFKADYMDENGICTCKSYYMYVRDLDMNPSHIDGFRPLAEKMQAEGRIESEYYATVQNHLLKIHDIDRAVRKDILENDSKNMYVYNHLQG